MNKLKMTLLVIIILLQGGCMKKEKDQVYIPQESEIVTWKQNDHLIVKAKLGERRKHIVNEHCPKCEQDFYKPEREHYLGKFPIDYKPEKFPEISIAEAKKLPLPYSDGQLEFDLMINGSTVQATDQSIATDRGLDHMDQVKVRLRNTRFDGRTSDVINYRSENKPNDFDLENSKKYGMKCWIFEKTDGLNCYGQSNYDQSAGVLFTHMNRNWVLARTFEPLYGGISIEWSIDKRNLHRWKEVDEAIWRLLEAWNVSPFNSEMKQ